jgi:hypothetical protein
MTRFTAALYAEIQASSTMTSDNSPYRKYAPFIRPQIATEALSEVAGGLIQELSVADFFHGKEMVDLARIELATSSLRTMMPAILPCPVSSHLASNL